MREIWVVSVQEVHETLNRLDSEADQLMSQDNPLDYASKHRNDLYMRALKIASDLVKVDKQLRSIIDKREMQPGIQIEAATRDNPLPAAVGVVNSQLLSLLNIDEQTGELRNALENLRTQGQK